MMNRMKLLGWGLVVSSAWFLHAWIIVGLVSVWNIVTRGELGGDGVPSGNLLLSLVAGAVLLGSGLFILYGRRHGGRP